MLSFARLGILLSLAMTVSSQFDPSQLLNLVSQIRVFITPDTFTNNLVIINFDVKNNLILPLNILQINSQAGLNDSVFAEFEHTFNPPFTILPFQTKNSGNISNVLLTQGLDASLAIVPFGVLDLDNDVLVSEIIPIPIPNLKQSSVPTTYTVTLS